MTPQAAIAILRGTASPQSVIHPQIAADMGADAIELMHWWFDGANEDGREAVRIKHEESRKSWLVEDWLESIREEMGK